ncbi:MAG: hypothetical protein LH645_01410 [Actinomycetia bacterium]|nr:hypothetical protein [Actinomycetes bacterium]
MAGAPLLVALLAVPAASLLGMSTALASSDTTAPSPFDILPDAGDYQTGYSVAAPYSNIYVSWQAAYDESSAVSYEMTVDGTVVRVVADVEAYLTITKRVEVPEGSHVLGVIALDAAGNRQTAVHTLQVVVDKVSPTFTSFPLLLLRRGQVTEDGYPMRYTWTGADVGTGLSQVRIGPGADCCYTTDPWRTSFDFTVEPESSVAWRLRLYDGVGRTTVTVRDGYVSTVPWSQTDRSKTWQRKSDPKAVGGSEWLSTMAGDRLKVDVDGRSVGWVATTGPTRGRADVLLNGRVVDTVNLYSAKRHEGRVVWAGKLPLGTANTLSIVNRSTKARHSVGVDALLLQR